MRDRARFSGKKSFFLSKKWVGEMGQKWSKNRVFWIYWKIWSLMFPEFDLYWNFILFAIFLHKSHIWEKSGSRSMGQNALGQSDCSVKSNICLEQNDEIAWFFTHWNKFMEIKSWLKNSGWVWSKMGVPTMIAGL